MRQILAGYGLLYVGLMALLFWASPSAANIPDPTYEAAVTPEPTCQGWFASWRADKSDMRAIMKQSIKKATADTDVPEAWSLCLLMNVDYIINTILYGCNMGLPLDVAFAVTFEATGERCAQ